MSKKIIACVVTLSLALSPLQIVAADNLKTRIRKGVNRATELASQNPGTTTAAAVVSFLGIWQGGRYLLSKRKPLGLPLAPAQPAPEVVQQPVTAEQLRAELQLLRLDVAELRQNAHRAVQQNPDFRRLRINSEPNLAAHMQPLASPEAQINDASQDRSAWLRTATQEMVAESRALAQSSGQPNTPENSSGSETGQAELKEASSAQMTVLAPAGSTAEELLASRVQARMSLKSQRAQRNLYSGFPTQESVRHGDESDSEAGEDRAAVCKHCSKDQEIQAELSNVRDAIGGLQQDNNELCRQLQIPAWEEQAQVESKRSASIQANGQSDTQSNNGSSDGGPARKATVVEEIQLLENRVRGLEDAYREAVNQQLAQADAKQAAASQRSGNGRELLDLQINATATPKNLAGLVQLNQLQETVLKQAVAIKMIQQQLRVKRLTRSAPITRPQQLSLATLPALQSLPAAQSNGGQDLQSQSEESQEPQASVAQTKLAPEPSADPSSASNSQLPFDVGAQGNGVSEQTQRNLQIFNLLLAQGKERLSLIAGEEVAQAEQPEAEAKKDAATLAATDEELYELVLAKMRMQVLEIGTQLGKKDLDEKDKTALRDQRRTLQKYCQSLTAFKREKPWADLDRYKEKSQGLMALCCPSDEECKALADRRVSVHVSFQQPDGSVMPPSPEETPTQDQAVEPAEENSSGDAGTPIATTTADKHAAARARFAAVQSMSLTTENQLYNQAGVTEASEAGASAAPAANGSSDKSAAAAAPAANDESSSSSSSAGDENGQQPNKSSDQGATALARPKVRRVNSYRTALPGQLGSGSDSQEATLEAEADEILEEEANKIEEKRKKQERERELFVESQQVGTRAPVNSTSAQPMVDPELQPVTSVDEGFDFGLDTPTAEQASSHSGLRPLQPQIPLLQQHDLIEAHIELGTADQQPAQAVQQLASIAEEHEAEQAEVQHKSDAASVVVQTNLLVPEDRIPTLAGKPSRDKSTVKQQAPILEALVEHDRLATPPVELNSAMTTPEQGSPTQVEQPADKAAQTSEAHQKSDAANSLMEAPVAGVASVQTGNAANNAQPKKEGDELYDKSDSGPEVMTHKPKLSVVVPS